MSFSTADSDKNLVKMPSVGHENEAAAPDPASDDQERVEDSEPSDHDEDDGEEHAQNPEHRSDDDYDRNLNVCDQDPRWRGPNARLATSVVVKTNQLFGYFDNPKDRRPFGRLLKIDEQPRLLDVLSLRDGAEITIPASANIQPSQLKWLLFHLEDDGHQISWSDKSQESLRLSRSFLRNGWRFLRVLVKKKGAVEVEAGKSYVVQIEKLCLKHVVKRSRNLSLELRKRVVRQRASLTVK